MTTHYAYFDPSSPIQPAPVLGWIDGTNPAWNETTLPPAASLLVLTDEQWANHHDSLWAVENATTLVPGTQSMPSAFGQTLATQAQQAIKLGLTISLSGSLVLPPTLFPTDTVTQNKINAIVNQLNTSELATGTASFFGGATTGRMKDATVPVAEWHVLTAMQYKIIASAIGAYVAELDMIIDGNPDNATALPPNEVVLSV